MINLFNWVFRAIVMITLGSIVILSLVLLSLILWDRRFFDVIDDVQEWINKSE